MKAKPPSLEKLRATYRAIRKRSHCEDPKVFDQVVQQLMAEKNWERTPASFVKVAKMARFPCRRCAETGRFVTRIENGKPVGPGGVCFRCAGKGWQDDADARRNYGADINRPA